MAKLELQQMSPDFLAGGFHIAWSQTEQSLNVNLATY